MNHIKAQALTIQALEAEITALRAGINDLVIYVNSKKFYLTDNKVSTGDVNLRLLETLSAANDAANSVLEHGGLQV